MPVLRVVLLAAAFLGLLAAATAQAAAPVGSLKQYKVPTAGSQPRAIANGADGNRWFTEGTDSVLSAIARITPAGAVTEFRPACDGCIVTDIAQGPADVLFFSSNDPVLGRLTPPGNLLPAILVRDVCG